MLKIIGKVESCITEDDHLQDIQVKRMYIQIPKELEDSFVQNNADTTLDIVNLIKNGLTTAT
jgi:hypothetical protein